MSFIDHIKNRTSVPKVSDEPLSDEIIEHILDCAVCTPVHYDTKPWRFAIIKGEDRHGFGSFMADFYSRDMDDLNEDAKRTKLKKIKTKPFRAPVIIAVGVAPTIHPKARREEDIAAVHAACQNILLSAEALGLGAMWRTGRITYVTETAHYLGFEGGVDLVGFIYLGHKNHASRPKKRASSTPFTHLFKDTTSN